MDSLARPDSCHPMQQKMPLGGLMVRRKMPWTGLKGPLTCAFRYILYDSLVFCYPLPQFAGVNLTSSVCKQVTESAAFASD